MNNFCGRSLRSVMSFVLSVFPSFIASGYNPGDIDEDKIEPNLHGRMFGYHERRRRSVTGQSSSWGIFAGWWWTCIGRPIGLSTGAW